ncbi:LytTR family transcriptional regulator [Acutalibacter sp. 1XD8-33]|uniref:LytTR family DNA-binding domain-containing protein n=1 Tax=Acutalibacter sp. 1XD8-33 TaxID=2320081 RepID=UPI000EA0788E|nr:LytTR family DNA-binding domain-containing protein [Acutalibacter sp. 1XD8-33]RKJ38564.1 LytTR family transcriptional regulator [Acutalibacter sp. 1XD8-33]
MKIRIEEDGALEELEVVIRCREASGAPARRVLEALDGCAARREKLTGWREGQAFPLEPGEVIYIEAVDKRTFLYTREEVYETPLRLYELEERLRERDFFRASKSAVVNFNAIRSLRPDLGGRLRLTMEGGEALFVSRQYAGALKKRLGL